MKCTIRAKKLRPGMKVRSVNEETHMYDGPWAEIWRVHRRWDAGDIEYVMVYDGFTDEALIFVCDPEDKIEVKVPFVPS